MLKIAEIIPKNKKILKKNNYYSLVRYTGNFSGFAAKTLMEAAQKQAEELKRN